MTNYSAKHWAIKAEKSAEEAERYASGIDLSNYVNKSELESSLEEYAPKNSLNAKADVDLGNTDLADLKNENGTLTWMGNSLLSSGRNVGDIFYTTRTDTELNGAVECNGATFNTSDFSGSESIGVLLSSGKVPYVSLTEYQTAIDTNGSCRAFGWDGGDSFRVPTIPAILLTKEQASVVGNGMTLGLNDGTNNLGLSTDSGTARYSAFTGTYGTPVGSTSSGTSQAQNKSAGVTTDPTKSGIVANLDTVQYRAMVQLANEATDEALITATSALQQIANKVDKTSATDRETVVGWGDPYYSSGVAIPVPKSDAPYTAPSAGLFFMCYSDSSGVSNKYFLVNGQYAWKYQYTSAANPNYNVIIQLSKGDILSTDTTNVPSNVYYCIFYPVKGG